MTAPDQLRSKFETWKSSPGPDTINDLMECCIPIIRATVKSVLGKLPHLQDDAESDAINSIYMTLDQCGPDPVAWVTDLARKLALKLRRNATTRSKVDVMDDMSLIPDTEDALELVDLSTDHQIIARMYSNGASDRTVMKELGISRERLKLAKLAIAEMYKSTEMEFSDSKIGSAGLYR